MKYVRVVLEGPDKAGKTFTIKKTAEILKEMGVEVEVLSFPSEAFRNSDIWKKVSELRTYDINFIQKWAIEVTLDVFNSVKDILAKYEKNEIQLGGISSSESKKEYPLVILEDRGMLSTIVYQFKMMMKNSDIVQPHHKRLRAHMSSYFKNWYNFVISINSTLSNIIFKGEAIDPVYFILNQTLNFTPDDREEVVRNNSASDKVFESEEEITKILYYETMKAFVDDWREGNQRYDVYQVHSSSGVYADMDYKTPLSEDIRGYNRFYKPLTSKFEADTSTLKVVSTILNEISSTLTRTV